MSNLLAYRLKMKLPKSEHPEEYLKHVRVIQCMADNWQLQCNHCSKVFKGRSHRAVCHLIGKTGEGVSVCAEFPKEEKMEFIKKVYPSLLAEEESQVKESGPQLKNRLL